MIVRFHPAALQEMREAEWYIEERRPRWGAKFRAEVAAVIVTFVKRQLPARLSGGGRPVP